MTYVLHRGPLDGHNGEIPPNCIPAVPMTLLLPDPARPRDPAFGVFYRCADRTDARGRLVYEHDPG